MPFQDKYFANLLYILYIMVFPYLAALFSQSPKKKEPSPLFKKFPELNQGQQYLQRRNMVQQAMKGHLKTIEGFQCQGQNSTSWCDNSSPCPSYGYCPPAPVNIKSNKDDYPPNPNPFPNRQLFASKHANYHDRYFRLC